LHTKKEVGPAVGQSIPDEPLRVVEDDFILVEEYDTFELFRRKAEVGAE
jgi:hypothetical protein